MVDKSTIAIVELSGKLDIMMQNINSVKEKQEEVAEDITQIKEAVYHPDAGLYARLRELEQWKATSSRLLWMIITSVITLTVATIYKAMII
jgi:type II secretory pathway component PulF